MADHTVPDYDLADELALTDPSQYRALFEPTRREIIRLLQERAATVTQLAAALDRPKGTIGHHVDALAAAGLVRVVRTRKVRAIEAKYWGRTARTFLLHDADDVGTTPLSPLAVAAAEYEAADQPTVSTVRYARVAADRLEEWQTALSRLASDFSYQSAGDGDPSFAMALALYPVDRPHLPREAE